MLERLPQLYLPEGAKLRGNGGVEHFGAQLLAAGWGEVETLGGEGAGLCHYALPVGGRTYDARLFLGSVPDSYPHTLHFGAAERGGEEGHGLLVLSNPEGDGWTSRWAGGTDEFAAAPELPQRASRTSQRLQLLAGQVFEHTLYSAALGEFRAEHISSASSERPRAYPATILLWSRVYCGSRTGVGVSSERVDPLPSRPLSPAPQQ